MAWGGTWIRAQAPAATDQAVDGFSQGDIWISELITTSPVLGASVAVCWFMLRSKLGSNGSGVRSTVERIENSVKHIDECVGDLRERVTKVEGTSGFVETELKVNRLSVHEMQVQMARVEQKLEDFS